MASQQSRAANKDSLKTILDAMEDIDGLTTLRRWVDVGFDKNGKPNCGKLVEAHVKQDLQIEMKKGCCGKTCQPC